MVQAICFDLDGTLFDDRQYVRAGLQCAGEKLAERASVNLGAEFEEAYFDRGVREGTFDLVLSEHDISDAHVPTLVDAYHDNDGELTPFPGTDETLAELADAYSLGLVTGGRNGADKLARLGLESHFDAVLVTSGRTYTKRDPDPFEAILDALEAEADAAVYVGDRPDLDFVQPNRLGMTTVRVETGQYADSEATGPATPAVSIPSVTELPALLDGTMSRL